jgi:catecholate siderophore receptor
MVTRRILATAVALAFVMGSAVAAPVAFDQPTQPLGDALKQFARTAGVTLTVDSALVSGRTAPALQQTLEPADALQQLLEGSGLVAASSSSGGFMVNREQRIDNADQQLPVVSVDAQAVSDPSVDPVHGYQARRSTTATKTDTPLKDVPQSVTVITREAIKDQGMRSMGDAVRYVPGMNMAQGEGNRDQLVIRGQNTTADFYVDGVRDDVQYFRDFYNIERVEALKGPNAMIFGRGGGGGVINRVEKAAGWNTVRDASLTLGSFETKRVAVDVGQGINETAAVRLNAMYEDSGSFRDYVDLERYGINPTVALAVGPETTIRLGFEYFHDERTADRGIPSFQGRPFETDSATFFGNPDLSFSGATNNILNALVEHRTDSGVLIRNRTVYGDYDKYYQNVFASGAVTVGGTVPMQAYNNDTQRQNFFNQTDLTYDLMTGALKHKLLAGMELGHEKTTDLRKNGTFQPGGTTLAGTPASSPTIFSPPITFANNGVSNADNASTAEVIAIYAQDQITLSPQWDVIAGLRFDRFSIDVHSNLGAGSDFSRDDNLVSPRLGLIYKPVESLSIYGSYSVSYLPSSGDQFSSLTLTTQALEPEEFTNYEIGAKWDVNPDLSLTSAVYQLDRTNTSAPDPNNAALTVQTGEQRSQGFELGLNGNITQAWQIMAAYAYQDAKITSTTAAAPAGRGVAGVPRHTASLWNKYQFAPAWGAGLGVTYQSEMFASISNAVVLPDFTRVDAALYYTFSKAFSAQLNVVNLLDEKHYVSAHNDNNISPGTTRGAFVTINASF